MLLLHYPTHYLLINEMQLILRLDEWNTYQTLIIIDNTSSNKKLEILFITLWKLDVNFFSLYSELNVQMLFFILTGCPIFLALCQTKLSLKRECRCFFLYAIVSICLKLVSVEECKEMFTIKYDITKHCVEYGKLFLDLNKIKRSVDNIMKPNKNNLYFKNRKIL